MLKFCGICSIILPISLLGFWIYLASFEDGFNTRQTIIYSSVVALYVAIQLVFSFRTLGLVKFPTRKSSNLLDDISSHLDSKTNETSLFIKISGIALIFANVCLIIYSLAVIQGFFYLLSGWGWVAIEKRMISSPLYLTFNIVIFFFFLLSIPTLIYCIKMFNTKRLMPNDD